MRESSHAGGGSSQERIPTAVDHGPSHDHQAQIAFIGTLALELAPFIPSTGANPPGDCRSPTCRPFLLGKVVNPGTPRG